jgi:pteridine reductase
VGRAISLSLASAGAGVIVHYHSSGADAEDLVTRIRRDGGEAWAVSADLGAPDGVAALVDAVDAIGPVDILVNSASIFPAEPLDSVTGELWDATMAVNLRSPFFLTQRLGGAMKARGEGIVINIADLAGLQVWSGYAAHSISKAGLVHLTRIAARALAPEVRVAAIAPGTVLPPEDTMPDELEKLASRAALRRIGSPDDVTRAVLYLISADFVTGEVLTVDGGRMLS